MKKRKRERRRGKERETTPQRRGLVKRGEHSHLYSPFVVFFFVLKRSSSPKTRERKKNAKEQKIEREVWWRRGTNKTISEMHSRDDDATHENHRKRTQQSTKHSFSSSL
jgi:hypothetical protein